MPIGFDILLQYFDNLPHVAVKSHGWVSLKPPPMIGAFGFVEKIGFCPKLWTVPQLFIPPPSLWPLENLIHSLKMI